MNEFAQPFAVLPAAVLPPSFQRQRSLGIIVTDSILLAFRLGAGAGFEPADGRNVLRENNL